MTGFARAEGQADGLAWVWELKSVNGRGLDIRCRLAAGAEHLDGAVRQACAERFKRGNISVQLTLTHADGQAKLKLNRELLDRLIGLQAELKGRVDPAPPRLEALLGVRGVIEAGDELESEEARAARDAALVRSLTIALDRMSAARREEGARLAPVLIGLIDEIARLADEAEASAALQPAQVKARFESQIKELMGQVPMPPEERLAQEIVLLAAKCDVREELDRLKAHIASAHQMLSAGGAIGRRLDFLCQELNREANTTCSKAADLALTRTGLALKSAVEQFREQVQNVE
jgi:uncharacterized protein (TIGR00255 family)